MKKIFFIVCSLFCVGMYAQDSQKWTLEECINYAIEHNIDIRQRELNKQNAAIDVNTAKMSRLPNLNAGVGQNWNFGRSNNTPSGIYENQTISNSNLSVSSNTPLFTGFRINNEIAKSKLDLEAATQNMAKAKDDLALNIASLFLQVLFNRELLKVSEEQLSLSKLQVERTEQLVEVGKVPASQLFDIKAQVAKDEVSVVQAQNNLQLSLLDLAQSLELERHTSFDIASPELGDVFGDNIRSILPPESIYDNAVGFKPQVKEQELRAESAKKTLKIARSGYMPSLSLGLGYGNSYFYDYTNEGKTFTTPDNVSYTFHNTSFRDQIKNNGGEYIGLSLNIPIFNRFAVRNQVRTARLNVDNQQLILENVKKTLYKEIQTAYLNAIAAQETYRSSMKSVAASQESFRYAEERYQVGKSSVFEFNEARTRFIQSVSEQIQAKYDFIFRSKILDFYNGLPIKL
ncbi:MAG: TolC family protein [Dysgonamonadaceae bacterium]|nr:TolC family protein [Dysgonamonadaceae bacterium]